MLLRRAGAIEATGSRRTGRDVGCGPVDAPPGPPPAPVPPAQVLADAALSPLRAFVNRFRDRERIRRVAEAATVIGAVLYAYGWYMLTVTFGRFDLSAEDVGFGFSALLVRVVPVLLLPAVVAGIVMKLVHMADTPLGRLVENLGPNGRTAFAMGPLVGLLFALPALLGFGLLQSVFDASTGSAVVRRIVVCVAMTAALALLFDLLVCLADSDWSWNGVVTQLFRAASLTAPLGALALARTLPLWARVIVGVAAVAELAFASPLSVRRWLTMRSSCHSGYW